MEVTQFHLMDLMEDLMYAMERDVVHTEHWMTKEEQETFAITIWLTKESLLNYSEPHPRTPSLVSASCFPVPEISSWHPLRLLGFHPNWFIASC